MAEPLDLERASIEPGVAGIIAPTARHFVEPIGAVRFVVEFLRDSVDERASS